MWEEVHVWSTLHQEAAGSLCLSECSNKSSVLLVLLLKTKDRRAAYYFEINIQSNMVPCFPLVISNKPCGCLQRKRRLWESAEPGQWHAPTWMSWLSSVNQYKDQKYVGIIYDFTEVMYPTTVKANSNQGMIVFKRWTSNNQQEYTMEGKMQLWN